MERKRNKRLSPCGESGLKSSDQAAELYDILSLPMRGEWIEIFVPFFGPAWPWVSPHAGEIWPPPPCIQSRGLSPCGESGLKYCPISKHTGHLCLSPCGESGLKSCVEATERIAIKSLPMRGEWIEMIFALSSFRSLCLSPCGESGLKFCYQWGVWVTAWVSPHAGRVD